MTTDLLLLLISALVVLAAVVLVRTAVAKADAIDRVAWRLRFPADLKVEAVTDFLGGLASLGPSSLSAQVLRRPVVVLEVDASPEHGIHHRLVVPRRLSAAVRSGLRAHLPDVRVETVEVPVLPTMNFACSLALTSHSRPLTTGHPAAVNAAVLASLDLTKGERLIWQWALAPAGHRPPPPVVGARRSFLHGLLGVSPTGTGEASALRAKHAHPMLSAWARVGVSGSDNRRARQLVRQSVAALAGAAAPGVRLRAGRLPARLVGRYLVRRTVPTLTAPLPLNALELATVGGWPIGGPVLPGLTLSGYRQAPASPEVPAVGRVFAIATYSGVERPVALSERASLEHTLIIGPTSSGKSAVVLNLIANDLAEGRAVVVIDAMGDLTADAVALPQMGDRDVALLDLTDTECPVGFNVLGGAERNPALVVDQVVAVFANVFRRGWGFQSDDLMRAATSLLVLDPDATLCDLPLVFGDEGFRRSLLERSDDPVLRRYWQSFGGLTPSEVSSRTGPLSNKIRQVLLRPAVRNVLGQPRPRLDLADLLEQRGVLLVRLATGELGEAATALLGSLFLSKLWQVVQGRTAVDRSSRHAVMLHIDEAHRFVGHLGLSLGDLLATARGHGLGACLSTQHLRQFGHLHADVLVNCRSKIVFRLGADDARIIGREFGPVLSAADLQALDRFEVAAQVSLGSTVAAPLTARTLPPPPLTGDAAAVRARSRHRYGRDRREVEAWLRQRSEHGPDTPPPSRKRRAS